MIGSSFFVLYASSFHRVFFFHNCFSRTNHICSEMSLASTFSWLSIDSLFVVSFAFIFDIEGQIRFSRRWVKWTWVWLRVLWYVLFLRFLFDCWRVRCWCFGVYHFCTNSSRVRCWCFFIWHFCTNRSQVQRWYTPCNVLVLKLLIFPPNFKISFIIIVWLYAHSISNRCDFYYSMIWRALMDGIQIPSNSGSRAPETGASIQCVADGREPMIHGLWGHGIFRICCKVHVYTCKGIPDVNVG